MNISFHCSECDEKHTIPLDEFSDDQESYEGGMGPKIEYWKTWEGSCTECDNYISITLNATEYPIGSGISDWSVNDSSGALKFSIK